MIIKYVVELLKRICSKYFNKPIGNKNSVILKSKDFRYPNKAEFLKFHNNCPRLEVFGFNYVHPLALIITDKIPMNEASRLGNLNLWDYCLINRFQKICHTYVFVSTYYSRGFIDDWSKNTEKQAINHIMFEYYSEVFYYYYFSARDIIAQILCTYYALDFKEKEISFNKTIINSIKDSNVQNLLLKFDEETRDSKEFRNSFTHRFTPTLPDHRSIISNSKRKINFGAGNFLQSDLIILNIDKSLTALSILMTELRKIIK